MNRTQIKEILSGSNSLRMDALVCQMSGTYTRYGILDYMKNLSLETDIPLYVSIGGCEALRDLFDARSIDVDGVIAPMVDSAYALEKFGDAFNSVFDANEHKSIKKLVRIESVSGLTAFCDTTAYDSYPVDGVILACSSDVDKNLILLKSAGEKKVPVYIDANSMSYGFGFTGYIRGVVSQFGFVHCENNLSLTDVLSYLEEADEYVLEDLLSCIKEDL